MPDNALLDSIKKASSAREVINIIIRLDEATIASVNNDYSTLVSISTKLQSFNFTDAIFTYQDKFYLEAYRKFITNINRLNINSDLKNKAIANCCCNDEELKALEKIPIFSGLAAGLVYLSGAGLFYSGITLLVSLYEQANALSPVAITGERFTHLEPYVGKRAAVWLSSAQKVLDTPFRFFSRCIHQVPILPARDKVDLKVAIDVVLKCKIQ